MAETLYPRVMVVVVMTVWPFFPLPGAVVKTGGDGDVGDITGDDGDKYLITATIDHGDCGVAMLVTLWC